MKASYWIVSILITIHITQLLWEKYHKKKAVPKRAPVVLHEQLLHSKVVYEMDCTPETEGYFKHRAKFIKPYTSTKYVDDLLVITTLKRVNSCTRLVGDIKINQDTIHLMTKDTGDIACASIYLSKCTYYILNEDRKVYQVIY